MLRLNRNCDYKCCDRCDFNEEIYSPFKTEKEMYEWIIHNEHHQDALKKYYKKSFFKK